MALPNPMAALPDFSRSQAGRERSNDAWGQIGGYADAVARLGMAAQAPVGPAAPGATPAMNPDGSPVASYNAGPPTEVQKVYNNRLRELGVPEHVIEGNAWNVADESGWQPGVVGDNGAAFGLNQWNGPRKQSLMEQAQKEGRNPSDPAFQAEHWYREMQSTHKNAYDRAVSAGSASGAADAILRYFEIPAATHLTRRSAAYAARGTGGFAPVVAQFGQ